MFSDEAKITVEAGKGGDGCVHFRREKYVPQGGPDGGNGGRGGDLIFKAINNIHTLSNFRHKKYFQAPNGKPGEKGNRTGKDGEDLILEVPVGTQIQSHGKIIADLTKKDQVITIAQGGIGGKGNAGFVNSIRQTPSFAEKGDIGEKLELELELKLVADVALVGYPSSGKSTFISVVSNAKPKVAEYHFTTLVPNLGVAKVEDKDLVFVDVPGLIEGAHEGKGLGHQFLRHIERSRYVLHLLDISAEDPLHDFEVIRGELEKFSPTLNEKPFLPVFTKIDLSDEEYEDAMTKAFEKKFGIKPFKVSAATHEGMDGLLKYVVSHLPQTVEEDIIEDEDEDDVVQFRPAETLKDHDRQVDIEKAKFWWSLSNQRLEQISRQTDWDNEGGRERVYDVLKKWNVLQKLEKLGAMPGDKLKIGEHVLEYRGT
ncbi:MAG TPA: GTPase ObgE [Candidatus Gracilibacteria bacterium]